MKPILLLDTNIICRFLLNDHPALSLQANEIFQSAQDGKTLLYLHEIVLAEVIWLLSKFYNLPREQIVDKLQQLLSQEWIQNTNKDLLHRSLTLFKTSTFSFPDCFLLYFGKHNSYNLLTFDQKLKKAAKK